MLEVWTLAHIALKSRVASTTLANLGVHSPARYLAPGSLQGDSGQGSVRAAFVWRFPRQEGGTYLRATCVANLDSPSLAAMSRNFHSERELSCTATPSTLCLVCAKTRGS